MLSAPYRVCLRSGFAALLSISVTVIGVTACKQAEEAPKPPRVTDTVLGDMVTAKDRAQQQTEQAMQQRQQQLEQAMQKEAESATP
jgi:hypothetical protein